MQILKESIPLYPPYVAGVLTQALGMTPRDSEFFAEAGDAVRAASTACGASETELAALSFQYPSQHPLGTCWNGGIVLHVWEGNWLISGDIFVKQGDAEAGRRLYRNAKSSPTYDRWPFKQDLERRIAEADERAALYLDDDRDNDPPTWMEGQSLCVGCHADEP